MFHNLLIKNFEVLFFIASEYDKIIKIMFGSVFMESLFSSFSLNWLDIVIIIVLFLGVFIGYTKGLIESVLDIAGVFIALIGAKYLTAPVSAFVINNTHFLDSIKAVLDKKIASGGINVYIIFKLFKNPPDTKIISAFIISIICFVALFFLINILLKVIKRLLKVTFSHTPLKSLDRLGGAAIGLAIASVLIYIFFAAVTPLTGVIPSDKGLALAINDSQFAKYFYLYNFIIPWLQKLYPTIK
jgi:uncharacterized membrane protein required for colicin V production